MAHDDEVANAAARLIAAEANALQASDLPGDFKTWAKGSPLGLAAYASPYPYRPAKHLELLSNFLRKAAYLPDQRIVVSMPPQAW